MPFSVRTFAVAFFLALLTVVPLGAQAEAGVAPLRLRAGDAVRLLVRDEPDLGGDYPVDESGQVLLPIVGLVRVAGRDFMEVRQEVAARFGRELARSELQLTPLLRIAVLGEVRQPNLYPVDPTYTLTDVLALAGGLAPSADPDRVSLLRDGRSVDLTVVAGAPTLADGLRSGDQVIVGRRSWLSENLATVITTSASITIAIFTALILR